MTSPLRGNNPRSQRYSDYRRPVDPIVPENSEIPELRRKNFLDEVDLVDEEQDRVQEICDRVTLAVLFFAAFYFGGHLFFWAWTGFSFGGGR